jgi:hypothetical protein
MQRGGGGGGAGSWQLAVLASGLQVPGPTPAAAAAAALALPPHEQTHELPCMAASSTEHYCFLYGLSASVPSSSSLGVGSSELGAGS